jgi:thiol-disulfide isomerase/thioredoxin
MRPTRLLATLALFIVAVCTFSRLSEAHSTQQPVDVKVVKYGDLCDIVAANKGKVILLDFWATTCIPCKESFFHTVELANRYRDKGLVVISVSTNQLPKDSEATVKASVIRFLQSQNANFTNVILDEPIDVLTSKLRLESIPCLYVFNRDGQWTQFIGEGLQRDADHRHPFVQQYVEYLLDQPPQKK